VTTSPTAAPQAARTDAAPHARRRWLPLLAWSVPPVYLAGVVAARALDQRLGSPGLSAAEATVIYLGFGAFAVVGALLVARRPRNPVGWLLAGTALLIALAPTGDLYAAWVMTTRGRPDALAVLGAWAQSWYWLAMLATVFIALPLLFPDGRLPSRRWWPVAACAAVGALGSVVLGMLTDTLTGQDVDYRIANPIGIDGFPPVEQSPVFPALSVLFAVGVLGGVAAVVVRFRRSRGAERQQMKWFLAAVAPLLLVPVADSLPGVVGGVMLGWVLIALPVAVAVAILRYRLDGIDVVINRALVYGLLTAIVVGVYVLVVGYLGAVLHREGDLAVSLVATGIVAVLFAPLRDRLQRAVSRLLYGRRAEPYAALSGLGEQLQSALAPDDVLPTIVGTVRESLRLPYAAIALDDGEPGRVAASAGVPVPGTVELPLMYRSEPVGRLVLGLRGGESEFSAADRRLLGDLARHAGVAVSAVRLTADLRRSRERLVAAREEERRRLRRDLHDGLGAQLAGLTVQAGVLRGLVRRDPEAAELLVDELRGELRTAIADIRRLVYGLRPPALDDLGLAGALERLAERSASEGPRVTVDVRTDDGADGALAAAVEVAAFRIVQEALTNVVRHASARTCDVRVVVGIDDVAVEVTDDGRGLPAELRAGVGLHSMRERAAEMGGECRIESPPGGGTRVLARLPRSGHA
jgi:signal transduction histidine kinase